jgi:hypothetical protein
LIFLLHMQLYRHPILKSQSTCTIEKVSINPTSKTIEIHWMVFLSYDYDALAPNVEVWIYFANAKSPSIQYLNPSVFIWWLRLCRCFGIQCQRPHPLGQCTVHWRQSLISHLEEPMLTEHPRLRKNVDSIEKSEVPIRESWE